MDLAGVNMAGRDVLTFETQIQCFHFRGKFDYNMFWEMKK